jgi:DNA-binding NarL/FixJ family response regulator
MQSSDRLTAKVVQVATLLWQGLTNKDIARVVITSEQVVKNYLRTAFDKTGVWTRLKLALFVAGQLARAGRNRASRNARRLEHLW